jgi:CubicO group peptidase (beta-lactamase class C family)
VVSCGKLDSGTDQDVDGDTVFEIGSITKTFTGLLLQDMVERGKMKLEDPVAKYLPSSVRMPNRSSKPISLLQLATHTSWLPKIPDNLDPQRAENPYADYTVEKMYAFLSGYRPPRNREVDWQYSTLGMGLLGHVMALKAGTNYESLVVDRICRSLKMDSTRITLTPELQSRSATGHNSIGEAVPSWDWPTLAGAGALRSTANDLLKYVSANLGLVPSHLTPLMEKTHAVYFDRPNGRHRGLAWFTTWGQQKTKIILHDGRTLGCSSFVGFDKAQRRGVVILSNATGIFDVRNLGLRLLDSEWQPGGRISDKLPKIPAPPKRPVVVQLDTKLLDACAGQYEFPPNTVLPTGAKVRIWREGDQLVWRARGDVMLPGTLNIYPESETNFFIKINGARLTFIKDGKGEVTAVIHHEAGLPDCEGKKLK